MRCQKELIVLIAALFNCEINLGKESISLKLEKGYELQPQSNLAAWISIKTDNNREPDPLRFVVFLSNKKYFGLPIDKTYRLDQ